jgi:hypothetical protein
MNVVPTKQDGDNRPTKHHRVGAAQQDAFSRYSSNFLRMKALLLCSEDDEGDEDLEAVAKINETFASAGLSNVLDINRHGNADDASSKRQRGNTSRPIQRGCVRKTRLSWELHPNLLLNDLFSQLDVAESAQTISDDEEEPGEQQPSTSQSRTMAQGENEASSAVRRRRATL